jgi:hypothetical protein
MSERTSTSIGGYGGLQVFAPQGRETTLWVDEQEAQYYLDIDAAHAAVMQMCADGNGPFGSVRRLMRSLSEDGWLSVLGEGSSRKTPKIRKAIRGMMTPVLRDRRSKTRSAGNQEVTTSESQIPKNPLYILSVTVSHQKYNDLSQRKSRREDVY